MTQFSIDSSSSNSVYITSHKSSEISKVFIFILLNS
ncbi:hypothetical protein NC651_001769 [Populus alba x Populus x berolinensis]|nr:hypothetical protein NC651_001769 [Populus alba x Populus x berolinensis]